MLTDLTTSGADPPTDRLRIDEEQVPREGVTVTRSLQLARTEGGGTALRMGRRVQTGIGEGSSGLSFDTALPTGQWPRTPNRMANRPLQSICACTGLLAD